MTRSEFFIAVTEEFGDLQGRALLRDLVMRELGDLTALAALEQGVPPKAVWQALCSAMDVPLRRRHGAGLPAPTRDTPA